MKAKNINEVTHQWCTEVLNLKSVVIDATSGNGYDTLFLSDHAYHVYAFDSSKIAISRTKEKTKHKTNITYIVDSHETIPHYVKEKVHGIMYNCGYLPNSDHTSMTQAKSTIASLNHAKAVLDNKAWICITVYLKHKGGANEAHQVKEWIDKNTILEKTYTYPEVKDAPIAYFCRIL